MHTYSEKAESEGAEGGGQEQSTPSWHLVLGGIFAHSDREATSDKVGCDLHHRGRISMDAAVKERLRCIVY